MPLHLCSAEATRQACPMSQRAKTVLIRQFIVDHVSEHSRDIASLVAERFRISRQAANKHLRAMEESGVIESDGQTRGRSYSLREIRRVERNYPVAGLQEHVPWQNDVLPVLIAAPVPVPKNVLQICSYGFTEMLNNVIDHSEGERAYVDCILTAECVDLKIIDHGVGIFRKIKDSLGLNSELEAIAELVKGKLTTDPVHHTGEGIFFTSRIFDYFMIFSGELYFTHTRPDDDWLLEDRAETCQGTYVRMTISLKARTKLKDVFDKFASTDGEFEFSRTHVPVKLLQYGADNLVSRSQAKRLLSRFEMFREVILDFAGVEMVGQAFADEVFRVYQNEHPNIRLVPINMNADVSAMVWRALSRRRQGNRADQPGR